MVVFMNNLKRLYRDKFTLIAMIILPVVFISFSMFGFGSSTPLKVTIIDLDHTELTASLRESLSKSTTIVELEEKDIKQKLINGKIDYAIKIEEGFTKDLIAGRNPKLKSYSLKETNSSMPVKFYIEGFINSTKNIAEAAKGDEGVFHKGMESYLANKVKAEYKSIENTERDTKGKTMAGLGFLTMFMLYLSSNAASLILEDKQLKTYGRILSSPLSPRSYFVQNLLSFIAIMLLQVVTIFAIMKFLYRADLGPNPGNLIGLFSIFSLTAVALGVAISSFSKDLKQSVALSNLIAVPMSMLGGCFWPREFMPDLLQQIGRFIPVTWALEAAEKLLYGSSFGEVMIEIGILLLFALVFLIIGSNKRLMMSGASK